MDRDTFDKHACPTCGQSIEVVQDLRFDFEANIVVGNGHIALLTPAEMQIIIALKDAYPRTLSKGALIERIYLHDQDAAEEKIVDVFVCKLRRKIKGIGFDVQTVWGKGHRFIWLDKDKTAAA